jgi:hypothetical protein
MGKSHRGSNNPNYTGTYNLKTYQLNYQRDWRNNNREKLKGIYKRSRIKNKDKRREWTRNYRKQRYKNDVNYRVRVIYYAGLSGRINGYHKQNKTTQYLGCSFEQLRRHLESKFQTGMSWDNYGEWHIDHIIPCSAFDFSQEEDIKKCWHYTNLQPLWAKDNISKGDKLPDGTLGRHYRIN